MNTEVERIKQDSFEILYKWIESCRRRGTISRNTVAVGIVVLDHLRRNCPVSRTDVISEGGEVKGARAGLGKILGNYGVSSKYLKEVTTRQAPQDGQKLFEWFNWGRKLAILPDQERDNLLTDLIEEVAKLAKEWLRRHNLKLEFNRRHAPTAWIRVILENARGNSGGVVEQHLVGAKLERRHMDIAVPNHPVHAADRQTDRDGDFTVAQTVYHVTATPSRRVIQRCANNVKVGQFPVLLVPSDQEYRAKALAQDEGVEEDITIISIEGFVALNIIEIATENRTNFFGVLQEIVEIYNKRLSQVETDLSLQIEVH